MGDLEDEPKQNPLDSGEVQDGIMALLPSDRFDLVLTHGPCGEYNRHLRHEETGKAVMALFKSERLFVNEIWRFAYEDGGGKYLPQPVKDADIRMKLTEEIWQKKYDIITKVYGFDPNSFEAKTIPRGEAFWLYKSGDNLWRHLNNRSLKK